MEKIVLHLIADGDDQDNYRVVDQTGREVAGIAGAEVQVMGGKGPLLILTIDSFEADVVGVSVK